MIFRATMLLGARHARAMLMRGHTPTAPTRCLVPATTVCSAFGASRSASTTARKAPKKDTFECIDCGRESVGWVAICPSCRGRDTMQLKPPGIPEAAANAKGGMGATAQALAEATRGGWVAPTTAPQRLADVALSASTQADRRTTLPGITGREVGRVLGGGVVPGSLVLFGGEPGIGKSTLLMQLALMLAQSGPHMLPGPVLYVSGEESVTQVADRATRLAAEPSLPAPPPDLMLLSATSMDSILQQAAALRPRAMVVDSIQTVFLGGVGGSAGSVQQVRECSAALLRLAKELGCPVFVVGHVTKTGDIAGPRLLEHIVDVVLYLQGDRQSALRLLRGMKNRYGPTDEVGVFEMTQAGLAAVPEPGAVFLEGRAAARQGAASAVTVVMEGSRPMCMEIQALCSPAVNLKERGPARVISGCSYTRVSMLLAVLTKQGIRTGRDDVYLNVVGGMTLTEPAVDLAIAVAVVSSVWEVPVPPDVVFLGEVGLGGELRAVPQVEKRVAEASKLGFRQAVVPAAARLAVSGLEVVACEGVLDAVQAVLGGPSATRKRGRRRRKEEDDFFPQDDD